MTKGGVALAHVLNLLCVEYHDNDLQKLYPIEPPLWRPVHINVVCSFLLYLIIDFWLVTKYSLNKVIHDPISTCGSLLY